MALVFGCICALAILVVGAELILRWRDPLAGVTVEGVVKTREGETLGAFTTSPAEAREAVEALQEGATPNDTNADNVPATTTETPGPAVGTHAPPSADQADERTPDPDAPQLQRAIRRATGGSGLPGALPGLLDGTRPAGLGSPRRVSSSRFYVSDRALGFKPRPNSQVTLAKRKRGEVVFEATYTVDDYSRRVTPSPQVTVEPKEALLFFGGSYTFGEGVNDDETMPARVAAETSDCQVYNYGLPGAGPQHMLEQLRAEGVERQVKQKRALAVFSFLHVHISRAVGTDRVLRGIGGSYPWYEWDEETQSLIRRGFFSERRGPRRTASGSKLLKFVEDYYGENLTRDDARLTARLVIEAKRQFERRFDSKGFYVLVYPLRDGPLTDHVIQLLRNDAVRILDYRPLLTTKINYDEYFIPDDGHPQPRTHKLIADRLVKDLRLRKRTARAAPVAEPIAKPSE